MTRKILNVRLAESALDRLDALAQGIGNSRAELARWLLITSCDQERLPPGYAELAQAKQARR